MTIPGDLRVIKSAFGCAALTDIKYLISLRAAAEAENCTIATEGHKLNPIRLQNYELILSLSLHSSFAGLH